MDLCRVVSSIVSFSFVLSLVACGGGSGGGTPPGNDNNNNNSTGGTTQSATCPATGSQSTGTVTRTQSETRGGVLAQAAVASNEVPGQLVVTYERSAGSRSALLASRAGGKTLGELDFAAVGKRSTLISVDDSKIGTAAATLRAQSGVQSVSRVHYSSKLTIGANDPYYSGFAGTLPPYYESSGIPGQWDMHVINAAAAWNDVSATTPVVGSKAPIAIVDTGVDVTHPELSGGTIIRTRCFVTYPMNGSQTTGPYVTDTNGHGTNVAGIASGVSNNNFGFASVSYDAKIMAYRVFPTDPGDCETNKTDTQCESDTFDEASAINDAVANGAKVINLSLGSSPPCSTSDPQYVAVENAIASHVVVVAAAGNGDANNIGQPYLDCPAGDPGVIAVGASALDDSGITVSETVAGYSNYVSSKGDGAGGAYLVAPGGYATGSSDSDDLHWVEHIYSSTGQNASTFCIPDHGAPAGSTIDCRASFNGTSQAAPHVAGAAALILAVKPAYTPDQVAAALCAGATDINVPAKQGCGRLDADAAVQYAKTH